MCGHLRRLDSSSTRCTSLVASMGMVKGGLYRASSYSPA